MAVSDQMLSKARRDGGSLVAVFPTAVPPLIWQIDLDRYHTFSLILKGGEGEGWQIGILSPKEDNAFHSIARFASQEDAEDAFAETQNAMLQKKPGFWNAAPWIGGAIAIAFLILFLSPSRVSGLHLGGGDSVAAPAIPAPRNFTPSGAAPPLPPELVKEGVPVSADDVLRPPP